jgi:Tfp pilus assembly protein PilN
MTTINLAPGTRYIAVARQQRRRLISIAISLAVILFLIWLTLFMYQRSLNNRQAAIEEQLRGAETEITKIEPDARRIIRFEQRLKILDSLLSTHITWNPLFQQLEKLLPPGTVLTSIQAGQETGRVTIQGATADIDQIAQTLASLLARENHQTIFTKGLLGNVDRQEQRTSDGQVTGAHYNFTADLSFPPSELFLK